MAGKKNDDLLNEIGDENSESVDLLDGLDDEASDLPAYWDPEPGDGVQGDVLRHITATTKMGEAPVVVLRKQDGDEVSVWGLRKVLREAIEADDPQPGDAWAAKYFGERSSKNGETTYHLYKTRIRRGSGKPPESKKDAPF